MSASDAESPYVAGGLQVFKAMLKSVLWYEAMSAVYPWR